MYTAKDPVVVALNNYLSSSEVAEQWADKNEAKIYDRSLELAACNSKDSELLDAVRDELTDDMLAYMIEMTLHGDTAIAVNSDLKRMIIKESHNAFEERAKRELMENEL